MPATPPDTAPQVHPLLNAGKFLLSDLLSTLTFVALYALTHSIYVATGLAIVLGLAQVAWFRLRGTPIEPLQWLSLFLVVVFGGATLLTHNPVFIKIKFTVIYTAVGIVMLRRGWMNRYAPPIARAHAGDVTVVFGYVWSALFFATGAANLVLAFYASPAVWAGFLAVFPLASKVVLTLTQYVVTRRIVRRRIRAAGAPALAGR